MIDKSYARAARRVRKPSVAARRSLFRAIREWANRSGYYVGPTGAIPCDVQYAFRIRRPPPPAPTEADCAERHVRWASEQGYE
jgi:hypothetical protein